MSAPIVAAVDPYSAKVREYFGAATHMGDVEAGIVGYYADQGLRLRFSAEVRGGRIMSLLFRCWGCPHTIAAAEAVCRQFDGADFAELANFNTAQIMLDLTVPVEKTGRILVVEDAVRSLHSAIRDQHSTA